MSNLTRIYISKPELLYFEMQRFRNESVCWFSGPNNTCKIELKNGLPLNIKSNKLKFGYILSRIASSFYRTRPNGYVQMSQKNLSLLNVFLRHWILGTLIGFQNALRVRGVGYHFDLLPTKIMIQAGYSHLLIQNLPLVVFFQSLVTNKKATFLRVKSFDLAKLNTFLSTIRNFRKPDIYKGKGIRYQKDFISRKEGKKKKST